MIFENEIKVGQGVGNVQFGIYEADLIALLGEPTLVEIQEYSIGEKVKEYMYDQFNISFEFTEIDDYRLRSIDIENNYFKIRAKEIIGLKLYELLELFEEFEFDKPKIDSIGNENEENHLMLYYDAQGIILNFVDYICISFSIGPLWKNNEEILWPKS